MSVEDNCWPTGREMDGDIVCKGEREAVKSGPGSWHAQKRQRTDHHLRDSNLKDIVLDQLLPQHDDAELYAQLHETASRSTLQKGDRSSQTLQALENWIRLS